MMVTLLQKRLENVRRCILNRVHTKTLKGHRESLVLNSPGAKGYPHIHGHTRDK